MVNNLRKRFLEKSRTAYTVSRTINFSTTSTLSRGSCQNTSFFQIRTINRKVMVMPIASRLVYYLENSAIWMKASGKYSNTLHYH